MDELATCADVTYGGTLLDSTLILVMSEVGDGKHQQENSDIYVAGGAGNSISIGNAIDANNAGVFNLYLGISKAFELSWGNCRFFCGRYVYQK